MSSSAFDPYLVLRQAGSTNNIQTNDDGGGGNSAQITYVVPTTGRYEIRANAVSGSATGDFTLSLEERSRLMQSHGLTGRRYAGRVQQIITGSIGFEQWEWGVTLFARDPLDIKKLVTDMRFDEVSAKYADFGDFFMGKLLGV